MASLEAPVIRLVALVLALAAFAAHAEEPAASPPPTAGPGKVPPIEPANALEGRALVEALRAGGYVLLVRHAKQGRFTEACNPAEPNLAPEGEAQARKLAAGLHALRIPVGSVRASKLCRAIETAQLLDEGPVTSTADLNPGTAVDKEIHAARQKLLAEPPKPGTNTILVSHAHNSTKPEERVTYDYVEAIVFRPGATGAATPVARIGMDDWEGLAK